MHTFGANVKRGEPMSLTDDDVREILKLIDESDLDELHIETATSFSTYRRERVAMEPLSLL